MSAQLTLRQLDQAASALRNEVLASGLEGVTITYLDNPMNYVALTVNCGDQRHRTYVPTQQLIDLWLGEACIAAEHIEPDIALLFMHEALRTQGLPQPTDWFQWHAVEGYARAEDALDPVVHLPANGFDCYLDRLPAPLCSTPFLRSDLLVDIRWVLPAGELNGAACVALETGDMVCLPRPRGTLYAGSIPLFSFHIQDDFLMLEDEHNTSPDDMSVGYPYDHDGHAQAPHVAHGEQSHLPDDNTVAARSASLSLETLPVAVSFVLGKRTMTVAEISSLCVGMTLSLDVVTPRVDVVAAGTLLAQGELVRLGDQLAVEIGTIRSTAGHPVDTP